MFLVVACCDGQTVCPRGADGPPLNLQDDQKHFISELLELLNGGQSTPWVRTVREML